MAENATWRPRDTHGKLSAAKEAALPDSAFAFPTQRKVPLTAASYVRDAIESFREIDDVTDEDRALAFENIRKAAAHYRVDMIETDWRQLGNQQVRPDYRRGNRRF